MTDEHDEQRERGRRWAWIAFFVVISSVVYPLSFGAVLWATSSGRMETDTFRKLDASVFAPCEWLERHADLYNDYVIWCIRQGTDDHIEN